MSTRIKGTDDMQSVIMKMSGGNPGAMTVCMNIIERGDMIDPDAAMGGFATLLSLDAYGIYESRIWMLYKDVCKEDLSTMMAIIRACQLGFVGAHTLNHAIDHRGDGINVGNLVRQVKDRLPAFVIDTGKVE